MEPEEAIEELRKIRTLKILGKYRTPALDCAIDALEKRVTKQLIFHHDTYPEHKWKLEDGEIDLYAFEVDYCNGPICERCHYSFCVNCNPDGFNAKDCVVDWYECPTCHKRVGRYQTTCDCGQKLRV